MEIISLYSDFAFSRNPIICADNTFSGTNELHIFIGNDLAYTGKVTSPVRVNISDIVDSLTEYFPEVSDENASPLCQVVDGLELAKRKVTVLIKNTEGDETDPVEFYVVPGGISKQNLRRLNQLGKDTFTARFSTAVNGNFFFTTRTADWRIVMKETEICPLYFLMDSGKDLTIIEGISKKSIAQIEDGMGIYALDIDTLRQSFFTQYNVLPSQFDIYAEGSYCCNIVIERASTTKERYRLKFRNSLGFFEMMELVGELSFTPIFTGDDEIPTFQQYDAVTDEFQTRKERLPQKLAISAATGPKRPDEIRFLLDMIGSDEVYLLDLIEIPLRVLPSIEEMEFRAKQQEPKEFTIKLELVESEMNIMQEVINGAEGRKPRVFSDTFSKQFN